MKIDRIRDGARAAADDDIAVEAPLEIRVAGKALTVVMRTPGHDEELARGFLYAESLIDAAADIVSSRARRAHRRRSRQRRRRHAAPRRAHARRRAPLLRVVVVRRLRQERHQRPARARARRVVVAARLGGDASSLPDRLRAAQPLFARTGGVHASGLFAADGTLELAREDVGRHNALDKIIGWALAAGRLPLADRCSSSPAASATRSCKRPSPPACRSSPPSVRRRRWRSISPSSSSVTLVGFVRDGGMNVYTHGERVT